MSAISLKSITGITSITTPAGVDNQLTLHTNNTTERVKIDVAGNVHVNNHLSISGVTTASQGLRVPNGSATSNYISVGNNGALRFWATTHSFADIRSGNLHFRNNSLDNVLEIQQDKDVFFYGNTYFQDARFDQTVTIADTITHHGDTDTKIRFSSNDNISFETAGTQRLKIHSVPGNVSNHISIGSSSSSNSANYYLAIKGYERSSQGASGDTVNIGIINQSGDVDATANIDFRLGQAAVSNTAAVRLLAGKGGGWTNTTSTRDGYFAISVANNAQVEEKLRITNSGRVGIGTDVPLSGTHISDGTAYGSPQNSSRKATLTISAGSESSADIQLLSANYNHIFFGDAADPNTGIIHYAHTGGSTDSMVFSTAGSQRLTINSTGHTTINSGAHDSGLSILAANNNQETKLRIQGKASDGTGHSFYLNAKRSANSCLLYTSPSPRD